MIAVAGLAAVAVLAFANGANDNPKPVATLAGAGLASTRRALLLGTLATFFGCLLALLLGRALAAGFSARGLVPAGLATSPAFVAAVATGAAATVALFTRLGLPISTTHALIGAIVGAGLAGGGVRWTPLATGFLMPLASSPLVAVAAAALLHPAARSPGTGLASDACVCLEPLPVPQSGATAARILAVRIGDATNCPPNTPGVRGRALADGLHWASALALSFGRGLQDGAKIAGIGIVLAAGAYPVSVAAGIALAMAAGGLLAARRVERTMAFGIVRLDSGGGLLANTVSSALVFGATAFGLPVSTTHVTAGTLAGLRLHGTGPERSWLGRILLAWLITLPLAGLLGAGVFVLAG